MKRILFLLLIFVGVMFAVKAEELTLFDVHASGSFESTGVPNPEPTTMTIGDYDFTVSNVYWQENGDDSYLAFVTNDDGKGYIVLPTFDDKIITSIRVYRPSLYAYDYEYKANFSINSEWVANLNWGMSGYYGTIHVPTLCQVPNQQIKITLESQNALARVNKIIVYYKYATEKKDLKQELFEVTIDGETVTFDENNYLEMEFPARTYAQIEFKYNDVYADVEYEYNRSGISSIYDGQHYEYYASKDVDLTVRAISNNVIEKHLKLLKHFPTEAPDATFSTTDGVLTDGDIVDIGKIITVYLEESEEFDFYVNDEFIASGKWFHNKYQLDAYDGEKVRLKAITKVEGRYGLLTKETEVTIIAHQPTESFFDFDEYNALSIPTSTIECSPSGYLNCLQNQVTILLTEAFQHTPTDNGYALCLRGGWSTTWNTFGPGELLISVPDGYYIKRIEFDKRCTGLGLMYKSKGDIINYVWRSWDEKYVNAVKFMRGSTFPYIYGFTVYYNRIPGIKKIEHNGFTLSETSGATFDYLLHVDSFDEDTNYAVTLTLTSKTDPSVVYEATNNVHSVYSEEVIPASGRARAAIRSMRIVGSINIPDVPDDEYRATATCYVNGSTPVSENVPQTLVTGVENINIDAVVTPEYYNLQGVRVMNPQSGEIYIVRRCDNVTKMKF